MKEWIDALKKGTALRFIDAVEPRGTPGNQPRGILGTSPDGAWVVVDALGGARMCNAELGAWKVLATGPHPAGAAFAGDDLVVVAWGRGGLVGVDLRGKAVWKETAAPDKLGAVRSGERAIRRLCVNADGEIVVAYALGCVRWLDPATGKELRRLALDKRSGTLREFDGETGLSDGDEYEAVFHEEILGFDPSGQHALAWLPAVYVGAHHPGELRLRDFASGSCTTIAAETLRPGTALLGPRGRWAIAWSSWAAIDLWDLVEKKHLGFRPVKETGLSSDRWGPMAAISPNGRHWVSAAAGELSLWETSAESPIDRIKMPSYPPIEGPLAFSPDGKTLYLCLDGHAIRIGVDT